MKTVLWIVYAIFWIGGIVTGGKAPNAPWTAPAFLIVAATLAFRKELIPAVLIGFTAELIGVHTGFPFGHYTYTEALGPKIAGVPIAIAAAWLLISDLLVWDRRLRLSSSLFLLAADLLIDPVAAGPLNYWRWQNPGTYYGIPVTNYLGWLAVAILISLAPVPRLKSRPTVTLTVILFFTILALRYHLWLPAAAGLILTSLSAIHWYPLSETPSSVLPESESQPH